MKRIFALALVFSFFIFHFSWLSENAFAQDELALTQEISSRSGRITVNYPEGWIASSDIQTDIQSLYASEAVTIAENQATLDSVKLGPPIPGSHLVFVMFPTLQVFPVNPNPQDFDEVVEFVFRETPVEQFEVSGYPAARARQPGGISFTIILMGPSILSVSAEGKSEAHTAAIDAMIAGMRISVPQDRFSPDRLTQTLRTSDGRVSFSAGEGWYFGTLDNVAYTSPLSSAIQDFFAPGGLMELGAVEGLFFGVIARSYADYFAPDTIPTQTDMRVVLDTTLAENGMFTLGTFEPAEISGFPALQADFEAGDFNIGRAYAVDAVHTIYVFTAIYAADHAQDFAPLVDALFQSVTIEPLPPEIAILPPEGLREGYRAPNFTTTMLDGTPLELHDLQGQVVMLNFWFTTCPPCRTEMPMMQQAFTTYQAQGFTILAVNNREVVPQITPFLAELDLHFPVVLDSTGKIQSQYGIWNYPTSIFVDRAGIVYGIQYGAISEEQMRNFIETGLARQ